MEGLHFRGNKHNMSLLLVMGLLVKDGSEREESLEEKKKSERLPSQSSVSSMSQLLSWGHSSSEERMYSCSNS